MTNKKSVLKDVFYRCLSAKDFEIDDLAMASLAVLRRVRVDFFDAEPVFW